MFVFRIAFINSVVVFFSSFSLSFFLGLKMLIQMFLVHLNFPLLPDADNLEHFNPRRTVKVY